MNDLEIRALLNPIMMKDWVEVAFDSNLSESIAFDGIREIPRH
jgi:hypothetical protein